MNVFSTSMRRIAGFMLVAGMAATAFAQTTRVYPIKDSLNVRERHRMRQWSFENHLSSFPAPKKDNWSIGIQQGFSWVMGDVAPQCGLGLGLNVRRSLGHALSVRVQSTIGNARGLDWRPHQGFDNNDALNGTYDAEVNYTTATYPYVYHNFRMRYLDANVQGVLTLNNLNFYNEQPKVLVHVFAGLGFMTYGTRVDALNAGGSIYNYTNIVATGHLRDRTDALNSLKNLLDGEYETPAEEHFSKPGFLGGTFIPVLVGGGGASIKLGRRVDLMLEHRITLTGDDLLDGQRWEETNTLTATYDIHHFTSLGLNFRLGKGNDSRWWTNPMTESYNSIRTLKAMSSKEKSDTDGDGVADAFDKEPQSPKGAPVDTQGRTLDSDGDGVPDFKDLEPYSPKGAQVDRDGIALDSDEDGVKDIFDREPHSAAGAQVDAKGVTIKAAAAAAPNMDEVLPTVHFDYGKADVKQEYYPQLFHIARLMQMYPDMKMRVTGHADQRNNLNKNAELSAKRAENVVEFISTKFGIDRSRFVIEFRGSDNPIFRDMPKGKDAESEQYFLMNRRVEFQVIR